MPSVRARCDRAWRCRWNASAVEMGAGAAAAPFGLRGGRSARLASAFSNCRAFWKSPRHSSAVPWHARPYASSAFAASSASTTRLGGGAPRSERQRAEHGFSSSVQAMTGCVSTLTGC